MDPQRLVSASLLRLRMNSPFFATLALFTHYRAENGIPTAATDGEVIYFNPGYLAGLKTKEQDGLLLHELLHAALLHGLRRGSRLRETWNVAADIVVNGMILETGSFELPPGGLRDPQLEKLSVEEVYDLLMQDKRGLSLPQLDLLDEGIPGGAGDGSSQPDAGGEIFKKSVRQLEAHWRGALQQAAVVRQASGQGSLPLGIQRQLEDVTQPQLDWRSYLWRYLVQTPTDFQGFDRRFVGQGLYLETLAGESVRVFVAVDTSGSVSSEQMGMFLGEVQGILGSYPHLQCQLFYADAALYGPFELGQEDGIPKPVGGGGTSFVPFFEWVERQQDPFGVGVCVYLTDGYGMFPKEGCGVPTLWVVTPGGLATEGFPFGDVVRLLLGW